MCICLLLGFYFGHFLMNLVLVWLFWCMFVSFRLSFCFAYSRLKNPKLPVPLISFNLSFTTHTCRNAFCWFTFLPCTITFTHLLIPYFVPMFLLNMSTLLTNVFISIYFFAYGLRSFMHSKWLSLRSLFNVS